MQKPHNIYVYASLLRGSGLAIFLLASTSLGAPAFSVEGYTVEQNQSQSDQVDSGFVNLNASRYEAIRRPSSRQLPVDLPAVGSLSNNGAGDIDIPTSDKLSASSAVALPNLALLSDEGRDADNNPAPLFAGTGYITPVATVVMPGSPLYPQRTQPSPSTDTQPVNNAIAIARQSQDTIANTPAVASTPMNFPPVTNAVMAEAKRIEAPSVASEISTSENVPSPEENKGSTISSTVALPPPPAPMLASQNPTAPESTGVVPTKTAPTIVASAPTVLGSTDIAATSSVTQSPALSNVSKQILGNIKQQNTPQPSAKSVRVDVKRVSPEVADIIKKAEQVYESSGVSMRVSSMQSDPNIELAHAYESLMAGDTAVAIGIYQSILRNNPINEDALFGLAATYHRTGQTDNARPLYGRLLAQNPSHREALNNFLVLVANEAPEEALAELAKLELRNPDFSPIPAQMGIIFDRLGNKEQARNKMIRAIQLAPENWAYKYNLAIMLDRQGFYADAAVLYKDLIAAGLQGEKIPASTDILQTRLNYIASRTNHADAG